MSDMRKMANFTALLLLVLSVVVVALLVKIRNVNDKMVSEGLTNEAAQKKLLDNLRSEHSLLLALKAQKEKVEEEKRNILIKHQDVNSNAHALKRSLDVKTAEFEALKKQMQDLKNNFDNVQNSLKEKEAVLGRVSQELEAKKREVLVARGETQKFSEGQKLTNDKFVALLKENEVIKGELAALKGGNAGNKVKRDSSPPQEPQKKADAPPEPKDAGAQKTKNAADGNNAKQESVQNEDEDEKGVPQEVVKEKAEREDGGTDDQEVEEMVREHQQGEKVGERQEDAVEEMVREHQQGEKVGERQEEAVEEMVREQQQGERIGERQEEAVEDKGKEQKEERVEERLEERTEEQQEERKEERQEEAVEARGQDQEEDDV